MVPYPWIVRARGFAPRLSLYYAVYFVGIGIQVPFLPVWLAAKGLPPALIGLTLAAPMAVRIFAVPLVTGVADRHDALRAAIIIGTLATAAGYGLVGAIGDPVAIVIVYFLSAFMFTSTMTLVDAYALRGLTQRGQSYGSVRLWGSATFILGSFGAGAVLHVVSAIHLIWFIVGAYALTAFAAFGLAPMASSSARRGEPDNPLALLRNPAVLAVMAGASLVQASHAVFYGFGTLAWQAQGLDNITIGSLWALGVTAEIILFAFSGRLPAAISPTVLLTIGAVGATLRWTGMAFDPPAAVLPLLQCLHALSFGATHLGAVGFLNRAAPSGLAATAQGYLSITLGLAMALATATSGWLFAAFGHYAYFAMAGAAAVGCALAALALARARTLDIAR